MSRHRGFGVNQLILIGAATPRFTPTSDFPYGTPVTEVDKLIKQAYTDRPQLVTSFGEMLFANPVSQSLRDWLRDQGFAATVHSMACTLYSLRDSDLRADLPCIHVPTWILHGKLDRVCPFPWLSKLKRNCRIKAYSFRTKRARCILRSATRI